ncbi:hypothetical protein OS122_02480 [Mycolicibacterium mucogenicum]|uniref:hypothetical protein n=1 Tax=Mycolicibacterium mucogenicum TaxID=56689 RepID=UPI002269F9CE|nr:hypothetical protein [Mycolicibacterium mucogenicum]MCX8559765.1 hypothetical protein [Mycolicibacterium mucogenicum]
MSDSQIDLIKTMLNRLPPPMRESMATKLVEGGVRYVPDAPPVNNLERLRHADVIGTLMKLDRLPPQAVILMATEMVNAGCRVDLPDAPPAFAPNKVPARPLGPEGDSPYRSALRAVHPELFAKIDAAEKARAEGNDQLAIDLIAELRPKAMAELEALRTRAAQITPEDFGK